MVRRLTRKRWIFTHAAPAGEATFNLKYDDWDNECPNSLDPTCRCGLRIDARTYAKALQNRAKANIELHKTNIKIYLQQQVGVEEN